MSSITHIAGLDCVVEDRYIRQRCAWCGAVLLEYDLARTAMIETPGEPMGKPAMWPVGRLVRVDGHMSFSLDDERLPDDACALAHFDLTAMLE